MGSYAVTGAASGIGQAIAKRLQAEGHRVITVDQRDAEIVADLSDPGNCEAVVAEIVRLAQGGLDGFVPCAGVGPETTRTGLIPLVNYFSVVAMVEGLLPSLTKTRGAVVLIASNSAQMTKYAPDYIAALLAGDVEAARTLAESGSGQAAYGGGKHALCRWMRRRAPSVAQSGVRLNAIAPGYTETGMTAAGLEDPRYGDAIREFIETIPIGRRGRPEDQANAALFLLSDAAAFIAGSVLFVDGGHDAMFRADEF